MNYDPTSKQNGTPASNCSNTLRVPRSGQWVWDIKSNHLDWSDEIYTIFGVDPKNFQNSYEAFLNLVHPDDRRAVENAVSQAIATQSPYDIHHRILFGDTEIHTVHEHATILLDKVGNPVQMRGTVEDITELHKLNRRHEYLQHHSPVLLFTGSVTTTLHCLYCSSNLAQVLGYDQGVFLGDSFKFGDIVHPDDFNRFTALVNEFNFQNRASARLRLKHKNGAYLYCRITLKSDPELKNGFIGYIENIHDSYIAQNKANLLQNLIDDITDAIFIIDPSSGDILDINRQAAEYLGYSRRELLKMKVAQIETRVTSPAQWRRSVNRLRKRQRLLIESEHRTKDGRILPVEISITYIDTDRAYIAAVVRDISHRRQIEQQLETYSSGLEELIEKRTEELKAANQKLQSYIDIVDNNILTSSTDLKGNITYISDAFCKKTGYTQQELIGKNHRIFRHPDTPDSTYTDMWGTITAGKIWESEMQVRCKDGSSFWVDITIEPNFDTRGTLSGYTAIRHDITYQKEAERLALTDPLTGLFNRRHFYDLFPKELRRAKRHGLCISFLMIDIDYFKQYNDTYGHKKGDQVLITVGALLRDILKRSDDFAFRLGGEEFGILFISKDFNHAERFAKKLLRTFRQMKIPHRSSLASKHVTASLGMVSTYVETIPQWETLYEMADKALYHVKESGRNNLFITTFI